jgi:EAL domain-containing protein (putative c-di-GMP-specific phosphodiesterase class I)
MQQQTQPNSPVHMPTLLVIERQRFQRRALCRLLRAAGATDIVEAVDLHAAQRLLAEHETAAWIIVADPDALGSRGVRALTELSGAEYLATFLLVCNRRGEAMEHLRDEAKRHGMNLLAALRKPVSVEEVDTLFRRLPPSVQAAPNLRRDVLNKDDLGECLRVGRLKVRFQPKVDLGSGRPVSCEAQAFVAHLHYGDMPPKSYATALAQLGAQRVMTASILRDAAKFVRTLRNKGLSTTVAINVAPEVLSEAGDAAVFDAYVRTLGITPADLALEVAELSSPHAAAHVGENLARLKMRGYALALDETSEPMPIDYPTHTHFSEIKLCYATLSKPGTEAENTQAVASTVRAAHRFGMLTCVVGLETAADLDQARSVGIDLGQGALFAESLSADESLAWIEREESVRSFRPSPPKHQRVG